MLFCYGEELLVPRPILKLEGHPLSAVHDCMYSIFIATLHIWRLSRKDVKMDHNFEFIRSCLYARALRTHARTHAHTQCKCMNNYYFRIWPLDANWFYRMRTELFRLEHVSFCFRRHMFSLTHQNSV